MKKVFAILLFHISCLCIGYAQTPLVYTDTCTVENIASADSILYEISNILIDEIKSDKKNRVVLKDCYKKEGLLILLLHKDFEINNAVKNISDKVANIPILGKKAKTVSGYTEAGLNGYIFCYLTIKVSSADVIMCMDGFQHVSEEGNDSAMSQGKILDSVPTEQKWDMILNKGQYVTMLTKALPLCESWKSTLFDKIISNI